MADISIPEGDNPVRYQASLGGNQKYRNMGNISGQAYLVRGQVTNVYYQKGTLDFNTYGSSISSGVTDGSGSAPIPVDFWGKNTDGKVFGCYRPVQKGSQILVAYIGGDTSRPIVIGVYPDNEASYELISPVHYNTGDDSTDDVQNDALGERKIYPNQQMMYESGKGDILRSMGGKSFLYISENGSGYLDDINYAYDEISDFYDADANEIEPTMTKAQSWLLVHEDNDSDEAADGHRTRFYVNRSGELMVTFANNNDPNNIVVLEASKDSGFKLTKRFDNSNVKEESEDYVQFGIGNGNNVSIKSVDSGDATSFYLDNGNIKFNTPKEGSITFDGVPVSAILGRVSDAESAANDAADKADNAASAGAIAQSAASEAASQALAASYAGEDAKSAAVDAQAAGEDAKAQAVDTRNRIIYYSSISNEKDVAIPGKYIIVNTDTYIKDGTIKTAHIGDAAITNAKIADLAVGTAQLEDAAITRGKIGNLAVGTAQIEDAAITDAKVGDLSADHLKAGTIDFSVISGIHINASEIDVGKIVADQIFVNGLGDISKNLGTVTSGKITGTNVNDDINTVQSGVNDLNNPNLMSVIEKQTASKQFAGLTSQYNVILARAKDDSISTTDLTTAYANLDNFITPLLKDTTKASNIDRYTYNDLTYTYNMALSNVQNALKDAYNTDISNMYTSVAVASQAASSAAIVASQAATTGDNASQAAAQASMAAKQAQSAGDNATSVANNASQAASGAVIAGSQAAAKADKAITAASQAQSAGNNATSVANNASQAASGAVIAGSQAAAKADKAITAANEAKSAGDNATSVANNASKAASSAILAGSQAVVTANEAKSAGDNATSVANNASQAASGAVIAGSQAAAKADKAITAANEAKSAGDNATSVANNASKAASSAILAGSQAVVTANEAKSAGDNATSVANNASQAASSAILAGSQAAVKADKAITAASQAQIAGNNATSVANNASQAASGAVIAGSQALVVGNAASDAYDKLKISNRNLALLSATGYVDTNSNVDILLDNDALILSDPVWVSFDWKVTQPGRWRINQVQTNSNEIWSNIFVENNASTDIVATSDILSGHYSGLISWTRIQSGTTKVRLHVNQTTNVGTLTINNFILSNSSKEVMWTPAETVLSNAVIGTAQIKDSAITNAQIANAAINSAKIANLAVGTAQIGDAAITNAKIGKLAVGTAQIANGAITNAQIGSLAVDTTNIKDAAINSAKIAKLAVGTAQIGDGAITNAKIGKLAVGTAQIGDGAITNAKIGKLAVGTAQISDLAVGTAQIGDGAITNAKIGKLAVGTAQIANGAITNAKIGKLAVGTAQIKDEAVNSAKIAKLAVGTAQIGDGAITNAKIGKLAVGTAQIGDGAITNAKIGKLAVGTAQISDLAVGTAQIGDGAITNAKIGKLAVGTAQIANGAITNAKIGKLAVGTAQIKDEAVNSAKIAKLAVGTAQIGDGAITNAKIGKLAVGTAQIANGAITDAQIGSLAVGTANIKDAAISSAKIANLAVGTAQIGDGAITNAKIGKLAVGTAQIANAAITDAQVGDVSANKLTAGTIDFHTITGKNINASNITTGKLSTERLNVDKLSAVSANLGDITTGTLKGVNIVAKTFSTPNGSFTTDENGAVVASNLTIRGVTNLIYNAALLGGAGGSNSSIPGWNLFTKGYYSNYTLHDGVPSIGFNSSTGSGAWVTFAQSKLYPLNDLHGQPYSASVWFIEDGSEAAMKYQFTLAFFDANGNRLASGYAGNTWNGNPTAQGWAYKTINNIISPSTAVYVAIQYWAYNGTGHALFSSPMLTQTAQSTGYQPDTGNIINAGIVNGSTINASTINGTTINGSTINGTTFHGGDINNNGNNTARFYPLTIDSSGSIRSYHIDSNFASSAKLYTGNLIISNRNMSANAGSNKFGGETAVLGGSSLTLSSGYTEGKDTDFTKHLVSEDQPGTTQLVLSGINGITLKGDDQKIHFHGMYSDKQPKGITFTPYGNINGDEGSTSGNWYVGYNLANMTAQFGIDNLSKNTINLYRPTFVDEIGAVGNRLSMGRLLLHAVDGNAQMYLLNDGSPAFVSPTIYNRTYSNGSNVYVTPNGRVGRSTSASKYKLDISKETSLSAANRLLSIDRASWIDKVSAEKLSSSITNKTELPESEINVNRHYGLIAEDLIKAGLDEFVIKGDNGQVEGIEYDRLWTVLIPKIRELSNQQIDDRMTISRMEKEIEELKQGR